ncbi:MAG: caspase family protein, partial [Bacteroidota bacterium]
TQQTYSVEMDSYRSLFAFKNLLVLICMILGTALYAQGQQYPAGIDNRNLQKAYETETTWVESFESNTRSWPLGLDGLTYARIHGGKYRLSIQRDSIWCVKKSLPQHGSNAFELEMRFQWVHVGAKWNVGMIFGSSQAGNGYILWITDDYRLQLRRFYRHHSIKVAEVKVGKQIQTSGLQTLTLQQINGQWKIVLNKQLVMLRQAMRLVGSEAGIVVNGDVTVEVEDVRQAKLLPPKKTPPRISLIAPTLSGSKEIVTRQPHQMIQGWVRAEAGLRRLLLNNQPINVDPKGFFSISLRVPTHGLKVVISALDHQGQETVRVLHLVYRPDFMSDVPSAHSPTKPEVRTERNYLLIIGINKYAYWPQLRNAVKDCRDVASTLVNGFQFDTRDVITLFNDEATRENILETLESLQTKVKPEDNVIIYYAGHGYYDRDSEVGFWVPVDARRGRTPDFIRNSTIHDYLRTIDSKHTFLIADACYAGSLLAQYRGGLLSESARSRWAFASGDIEKVWDGKPGENSPFAKYLIYYLNTMPKDRIPANELIRKVSVAVARNTAQTPVGNPLRMAGDDGGVFIFQRER